MLRVAIVGCGLIVANKHLPALLKLRHKLKIVALCDLDASRAEALAKIYQIKKVYTDFSQMLREIRPDIVDISTPPATHAKLSIEAMENNCHILLEKPMALDLADCEKIIAAAKKYNCKVCVIHNQIFNPVFLRAKEIIAKDRIGKFLGMRIFLSTPVDYMTSKERHWAHKLPGGVLGETGPHIVYMSLAFLDNIKEVKVYAKKQIPEFAWSPFEDFRIDLIADNGISSVTLIYGSNQWAADVEIFCSEGILRLDLQNRLLVKYDRHKLNPWHIVCSAFNQIYQTTAGVISGGLHYIGGFKSDAHYIIISKFIESILNNTPSPITVEEAREAVRVTETMVESLEK